MRRSRVAGLLAALALLAAACTGRGGRDPGAQVRRELVVGTPADTYRIEGDAANLAMFPINANVFETLVRMTPDFQVEPWLAERWELRGENTWRFHLRRNVRFHDGQPFTAEAVVFSLGRLARGGGGGMGIGANSVIEVDEHTVDVTPTFPNRALVDQLVEPSLGAMIAPGTEVGRRPTGTGPFTVKEYVPGQQLVVERFPGYWGRRARLERIVFRFIPEDNARWAALRRGEVDLIYDLPRELLPEARRTREVELGITPPGASEVMLLNRTGPEPFTILRDVRVRRAVAHAVDRGAIVRQVWRGAAEVGTTVTPAALLGKHASIVKGLAFDPARARSLLDEAGWRPGPDGVRTRDGRRLTLTMVNGYPPIGLRKPMPEVVRRQLAQVGIEVKVEETPELAAYLERLGNGAGDIFLERVSQNDANASFLARTFFYSRAGTDYAVLFSVGEELDRLVEESREAAKRDDATRKAAEAMRVAVDREAAVVPVAAVYWLFAMKRGVEGFTLHGSARHVRWAPVHWAS